jgi:sugar phosphate isomerase/epimerase
MHVHLKDYVLDSEDDTYRTLSGRTIKEVKLGTGVIDIDRILNILESVGYNGVFSIEDNSTTDYKATAENALGIIP